MDARKVLGLSASEWLCLCIGIALQIQITLWHDADAYKGLRLNLADAILPIAGILVIISLIRKKSIWPVWRVFHIWHWLTGLFLLLLCATFHTYLLYGEWSHWALINKLPGFIVLTCFFSLAGWIVTNSSQRPIQLFFKAAAFFFCAVMALELSVLLINDFFITGFSQITGIEAPLKGLMDNRNAYVLWILMITGFLAVFDMQKDFLIPHKALLALMVALPYFMVLNASRTGMIAAAVLIILLVILYKKRFLPFLLCLLAGSVLVGGLYVTAPQKLVLIREAERFDVASIIAETHDNTTVALHRGDSDRLAVMDVAAQMIAQHPILGSGLGSSFIEQAKVRDRYDIIHCTPLWLWVETGLPGLLAFSAFFLICFRRTLAASHDGDFYGALNKGMALAMVTFAVMALFHEVTYTRQMWFLLGMALAVPSMRRAGSTS